MKRNDGIVVTGGRVQAGALAAGRGARATGAVGGHTPLQGVGGDTYNIQGQTGAAGPGAHAHDNTFQQVQAGGLDLAKLAEELGRLRAAMRDQATGTREQDKATGAVADAEEAAAKGDGTAAMRHLRSAGAWTLGVAERIGVAIATEALKRAM